MKSLTVQSQLAVNAIMQHLNVCTVPLLPIDELFIYSAGPGINIHNSIMSIHNNNLLH